MHGLKIINICRLDELCLHQVWIPSEASLESTLLRLCWIVNYKPYATQRLLMGAAPRAVAG